MADSVADLTETAEWTIITRPNCSLSATGRLLFFCVMLLLSFGIAIAFASLGAWLILPFSGLEVLALGWALYYIGCHRNDYECIVITRDRMIVETRSHKRVEQVELQRYWAQVVVLAASGRGRCRVWVRARGQEVELGQFANDDERMALAQELKSLTGTGYRV